MDNRLKRWIIIAMLTSIAVVVSYVESFIPMFIPGVKIGLANVIILIMLYEFKAYEALTTNIIRILLVGLIRGTLLTPTFFMSLSGGLLSFVFMFILSRFKVLSIFGVSVIGSLAHVTGQIIIAIILIDSVNLIYYLPFMGIISIATGILSAFIAKEFLKRKLTSKFLEENV